MLITRPILNARFILMLLFCNVAVAAEDSDQSPFAVFSRCSQSEFASLGWIDSRNTRSLNGSWKFLVDPMQVGTPGSQRIFGGWATSRKPEDEYQLLEYSYADAADVRVPGDFNTQFDELLYYRDTVWYQRRFDVEHMEEGRYHLWFGGELQDDHIFKWACDSPPVGWLCTFFGGCYGASFIR